MTLLHTKTMPKKSKRGEIIQTEADNEEYASILLKFQIIVILSVIAGLILGIFLMYIILL